MQPWKLPDHRFIFHKEGGRFFNLFSTLLNIMIEINVFHLLGNSPVLGLMLELNWHSFECPEATVMNAFKGCK